MNEEYIQRGDLVRIIKGKKKHGKAIVLDCHDGAIKILLTGFNDVYWINEFKCEIIKKYYNINDKGFLD
jgi:ribosomal protein L24